VTVYSALLTVLGAHYPCSPRRRCSRSVKRCLVYTRERGPCSRLLEIYYPCSRCL